MVVGPADPVDSVEPVGPGPMEPLESVAAGLVELPIDGMVNIFFWPPLTLMDFQWF